MAQNPNLVNSASQTLQGPQTPNSPLLNGISAAGGWGKALGGLMQLPGQWINQFNTSQQAANAKSAAAGQPYRPYTGSNTNIGITQNAKALAASQKTQPPTSSGIIPVANAQTNSPTGGAGVSDVPNNNGTLQSQLSSAQTQLASLQAQQAALDKSNAAANTYSGGVNANGQTLPGYVPVPSGSPTGTGSNIDTNAPLTTAGILPSLLNITANNQDVTNAQKVILDLKNQQAQEMVDTNKRPGTLTNDVLGQQGVMSTLFAQQQANAQANLTSALTEQSQQQSGLSTALNAVSPTVGAYGQTQYLPTGGTVGGGTGATVSESDPFYATMQTYAQALASGQGSAIPSSVTGNPALQAQLLQMAKAINPNFNYNQATATGQSQQAQTGQAQQWQSFQSQSQAQTTQLNQLISQAGINPSDINAVNAGIQKIANNTSDPNYATFQNIVQSIANDYANILTPAGSTVTDYKSQLATSLIDAAQSGQSIMTVINNLDATATAKINNSQTAYGNTNTNSVQYNSDGTLKAVSF
jgi:hypothetical protein